MVVDGATECGSGGRSSNVYGPVDNPILVMGEPRTNKIMGTNLRDLRHSETPWNSGSVCCQNTVLEIDHSARIVSDSLWCELDIVDKSLNLTK